MLLFYLSIIFSICHASGSITGCDEGQKHCLKTNNSIYPMVCTFMNNVHEQCTFTYSAVIEGDFMEVEIQGFAKEDSYIAASYSIDDHMGDDYALFCTRGQRNEISKKNMGVSWITAPEKVPSPQISIRDHEKTKKLNVEYLAIKLDENDMLYCKFRHLVQPIKQFTNDSGKVNIIMAMGVTVGGKIGYHVGGRDPLGQIDLNSEASSTSSYIATNLMTLSALVFVIRMF